MKNRTLTNILVQLLIFSLLSVIYPLTASAVDISAGAAVWYAWWKPAWINQLKEPHSTEDTVTSFNMDPNFMLGPALSVKINPEISLTGIFLWGSWYKVNSTTVSNSRTPLNPGDDRISTQTLKIKKYDLDTALNYAFNDTIKVFAGVKYQGYSYTDNEISVDFSRITTASNSFKIKSGSIGPGAGVGITYPLGANFYLILNASGIYMYNTTESTKLPLKHYNILGWNGSTALSYYMDAWNTTFSLGGRYQYLHYKVRESGPYNPAEINDQDPFDDNADRFYGITFVTTYNFKI